ncbi:MAG: metallophosphoesterase [Bacteroidetes bacterium]|nr:metallophosphoesterase [Bacteroidota bacterium]
MIRQNIIWLIFFLLVPLLGIFYIGRRFIHPMKWKRRTKLGAWILLVAMFCLPVFSMRFLRSHGETAYLFSWGVFTGLGLLSFIFVLLFFRDCSLLLMHMVRKTGSFFSPKIVPLDSSRREFLVQSSNLGILAASGIAVSYGIYEARKTPGVVHLEIPVERLPNAFHGFKIVQISDIHAGLTVDGAWIEKVVEEVQKQQPDCIAFTGDMVDGSVRQLQNDVAPLKELSAPYGKYFTTGNHEYYSGAPEWIAYAGTLGFDVLMNEHRAVEKENEKIILAGVTDFTAGQFYKEQASDPRKAIDSAPNDAVKILLAHQPRTIYNIEGLDYDLVLSGHTHGGQFFPWNLLATFGQPFIKGLHQWNSALVYVSKGTGYWGPPVRLGARSEITVVTLKKKNLI